MIKSDSFKLGLTNVFIRVIGLFILVPVYKLLEEQGVLLIAISFIPFIFFTDFCSIGIIPGFSFITSKYIKENKEEQLSYIFSKSKKIMLGIGVVFSIGLIIFTPLLTDIYDHNISLKLIKLSFVAIIPTIFIFPLVSLHRGFLLGKQKINNVSISIIIEHITRFITIFISTHLAIKVFNLNHYIAVIFFILANFIGLLTSFFYLRVKTKNLLLDVEKVKYIKELFTTFIPIGLTTIFITVYLAIDLFTVSAIKDDNMALFLFKIPRLLIIPILLSQAVAATTMPLITRTPDVKKKTIEINKAFDSVIAVGIISIFLYIYFSDYIFSLFYQPNQMSSWALKYFTILILLYSLNKVLIGIIQGIKKLKYIVIATLISYMAKFVINLLLVKKLAYYTFLLSSIISVLIIIITSLVILRREKYYYFNDLFKNLLTNVLVALIGLVLLTFLNQVWSVNKSNNKFVISIYLAINFIVYISLFIKLKRLFNKVKT